MNMKNGFLLGLCLIMLSCSSSEENISNYPETKKVDQVDTYFGHEVQDPYRWLEDDRSEETALWVSEENKVTFDYLSHIPFRAKIKDRLAELMDYERVYAPSQHGDYEYYYRNDGLQNQNVLYRHPIEGGDDEVFLDPNKFKEDGTISIGGTSFSDDGKYFTYLISEGGSDWRKAITIDAESKVQVDDTLRNIKFSGVSWLANDGFYYTSYDQPEAGEELSGLVSRGKAYFHKLGSPQEEDQLILDPKEDKARANAYLTDENRFLPRVGPGR